MSQFEKEDILHVRVYDEHEASSVELSPNITAELNDKGDLIGIEIVDASSYVRDAILESVQANVLHLSESSVESGSLQRAEAVYLNNGMHADAALTAGRAGDPWRSQDAHQEHAHGICPSRMEPH